MNQSIPLILHNKSKIYEFTLPKTYNQLIDYCENTIDQFLSHAIIFNYLDGEGDMIQISSEYDYKQALIYLEGRNDEVFILSVEEFNKDINIKESFEKTNEIVQHFYNMKIKEKALKLLKFNIKIGKHFITILNNKLIITKKLAVNSIQEFSKFCCAIKIQINNNTIDSIKRDNNDSNKSIMQINLNTYIKNHIKSLIDIGSICEQIKHKFLLSISLKQSYFYYCSTTSEIKEKNKLTTNVNTTIHYNISCSKCKILHIKGIRYKCLVCPNYNLCQDCEESNYLNSIHPHNFFKMKQRENISYQCLTQ